MRSHVDETEAFMQAFADAIQELGHAVNPYGRKWEDHRDFYWPDFLPELDEEGFPVDVDVQASWTAAAKQARDDWFDLKGQFTGSRHYGAHLGDPVLRTERRG